MKIAHPILIGALVLTLLCAGVTAPAAAEVTGQISVINLTMDPEVLMPGDTATVTAVIKNSGTTSVSIGRAMIMGVNEVYSAEDKAYNSVGMLGPGDEMTFTFPITSRGAVGTFYPMLYLDFLDAGLTSLKYTFAVRVDDTQLSVALIDQPDAFGQSRNEKVTIRVGNPRANSLNGIQITVSGDGVSSKQTAYFVGKLESDQYIDANLTVVVDKPTDISFDVSYRNGQNLHTNSVQIPVEPPGMSTTQDWRTQNPSWLPQPKQHLLPRWRPMLLDPLSRTELQSLMLRSSIQNPISLILSFPIKIQTVTRTVLLFQ